MAVTRLTRAVSLSLTVLFGPNVGLWDSRQTVVVSIPSTLSQYLIDGADVPIFV